MSELTPMLRQYKAVKSQYPDAILFFRLGDFYEMFFEDAHVASPILEITLTARHKNEANPVPMCGVPAASYRSYVHKLLKAGHQVALCDQVEDAGSAKGIVKREVVQVYSPGAVLDSECHEGFENRFLLAICPDRQGVGLAWADVSTGYTEIRQLSSLDDLPDTLSLIQPREVVYPESAKEAAWAVKGQEQLRETRWSALGGWSFDADYGADLFLRCFATKPEAWGLHDCPIAYRALLALLSYLDSHKLLKPQMLARPRVCVTSDTLLIDAVTERNLELTRTLGEASRHGSLWGHMDLCVTPMGSRLLKDWLRRPRRSLEEIESRLDAVEWLKSEPVRLNDVRLELKGVGDLDRLINRVSAGLAHARDVLALATSLNRLPKIHSFLQGSDRELIQDIVKDIPDLASMVSDIEMTLVTEPPIALKEGGLIRQGIHPELDEWRNLETNSKSVLSQMEATLRDKTGISSLKIRFNRVFGYYLEVTHTHAHKVPDYFIRKQTLANAERYITPELKEYEEKILRATERIQTLEYEIFLQLRERVAQYHEVIRHASLALARLDCFGSLAELANRYKYCRPSLVSEPVIKLVASRHPLVEALHRDEVFVPNDIVMDTNSSFMLITGPNMAGKSTVMRQVALCVLMAHMGSFVPAGEASIGITDRIFTRLGASDHLQKGLSTFMVEMLETAQILAQSSKYSLIIMDEIGRGTSTFDGLSIAWSVAETLHNEVSARTMFATHYHELTELSETCLKLKNYHMAVAEQDDRIIFLRRLVEGSTNHSFGVHVAAMAGIPVATIARAKEILHRLEQNRDLSVRVSSGAEKKKESKSTSLAGEQPLLFVQDESPVLKELKRMNIMEMTPIAALNWLAEKQRKLG